jgi:cytoskeletal protein CcmA (bactofilin family)
LSSRRPASKVATPVPAAPDGKLENGSNGQRNSVVLGPRDRLVGQLYIEGDLRVSGTVDGALEATGDIEIAGSGKVSGAVTAYNRLVVGSDASLVGSDVRVARLTVEDGATFTGRVSMGKHQATVPAEPEPASAEPVAEPVAEQPVAASEAKVTDDFSTPRASAGWSKRRKGR